MRIATIYLLIDVSTDADACDFLSETLGTMPHFVVDWAHMSRTWPGEATVEYQPPIKYEEGDFLSAVEDIR